MHVLLVSLKSDMMPVGLAYIAAAIKQAGHTLECHTFETTDELRKRLESDYDIVASGGLSLQYHDLKVIINEALNCGKKTLVGGGIITSEPELMARALGADFSVIGEGEETVVALLDCLATGGDITRVAGIGFFEGDKFVQTEAREQRENLDALPFPDYSGLQYEAYLDTAKPSDQYFYDLFDSPREYPIITSRSCPYQCTFCYHPTGEKYRQRSIGSVMDELVDVVPKYRINIVSIYDELFSYKEERVYEFCRRFKELANSVPWEVKWNCQMRVSGLKDDMLDEMREAGCYMVSYGFESYHPDVLKSMKKHIKPEQIHHAVHATLERGISIQANFIFGDPAETLETTLETLNFWKAHKDAGILLAFIITCPNSERYQQAIARGFIDDRFDYIANHLRDILNMTAMSDDDFLKAQYLVKKYKYLYYSHAIPIEHTKTSMTIRCPHCREVSVYRNYKVSPKKLNQMIYCRNCRRRLFAVSRLHHYMMQVKGRLRTFTAFKIGEKLKQRRKQRKLAICTYSMS